MHRLTIVNRSAIAVWCGHNGSRPEAFDIIYPSATVTTRVPGHRLNLSLAPYMNHEKKDSTSIHEGWGSGLNGVVIGHSLTFGATWAVLKASEGSPWIIYRSKVLAALDIGVCERLIAMQAHQRPPPSSHSTSKRYVQVLERHT